MPDLNELPTAVAINHVSKDFKLPHENRNSLKEKILHPRAKSGYDHLHALRDIDFEVKKGEFFGIVGRNGSGKSTLLKIIGGIYQPTKGSVSVNGSLTPFIELGIGFNPELTGRENVYLNGAILGLTRKEINRKYKEIVEFAELERFMDQKLKNYSSGMQVRLAFSIAIQAHNDILLIDEVLAVGDANFQRKCFKVFRDIKNSGKTVIFVTHAMEMVQEFCDRALMIQDSRVVAIGDPRDIAVRYEQANQETAQQVAPGEKLPRPRNPEIHIEDFVVTNKEGKHLKEFSLKDDIVGKLTINVKKSTEAQISMFIVNSNGEYVVGVNTYKNLGRFKPETGEHQLQCTFEGGLLPKGTYSIGIAISTLDDLPELIDIIDRAYEAKMPSIVVAESSTYQDGHFYMPGVWREIS